MSTIAVGIVEDEPIVRESLVTFFDDQPNLQVVCQVKSLEHFQEFYADGTEKTPDVLLLDIGLPGMSGLEGIRVIKKTIPDTDIIMLTTYEESEIIFKALCAGACSYLSKRSSLSQILEAITVVHQGGSYMSPSIARKVVTYFSPTDNSKKELLTPRQQQIPLKRQLWSHSFTGSFLRAGPSESSKNKKGEKIEALENFGRSEGFPC